MSGINKAASGALKKKKKRDQLIKEIASRSGQLKITNIFLKSSETFTNKKTTCDGSSSIETCSVVNDENNDQFSSVGRMDIEKNISSEILFNQSEIRDPSSHSDISSEHHANDIQNCLNVVQSETYERNTEQIQSDERAEMNHEGVVSNESLIVSVCVPEMEILEKSISLQNDLRSQSIVEQSDQDNITVATDMATFLNRNTLTVEWLLKNYDCLELSRKKVSNNKTRPFIHCNVCKEFKNVAKAGSKNGSLPMVDGIRVDGMYRLHRVEEHLNGKSHKDAVMAKRKHETWNAGSESHVWRKYLNSQHRDLINLLIRMAMDVYNDSLHDTLPAWNWAARSLTQYRSDQFVDSISKEGFNNALPPFIPSDSLLRYRNPTIYSEMLGIIADLEVERITENINNSVCFSMQIDGSLDRSRCDAKFVCTRYIEPDGTMRSVFLAVHQPVQNGAKGLLETAVTTMNETKVNRDKLVSLTTDGEAANTGSKAGLWILLEKELKRKILTIWCACHRSDLALEDLEDLIPELKLWEINVLACSKYFRSSKNHTKSLEDFSKIIGIKLLSFPKHFEVRFAEHWNALLKVTLQNLPACKKVWLSIVNSTSSDYTVKDKAKASDFLNTWYFDSLQFKLTSLMCDVTNVLTFLQKGLQKSYLILPDVLTLRDAAIRKLVIISSSPMPGGKEEATLVKTNEKNSTIRSHFQTDADGKYNEIRSRIVTTATDLISKRLNIENDNDQSIEKIKKIVTATTCSELVKHSVAAFKLFVDDDDQENSSKICELVDNVCEQWPVLNEIPNLDTSDVGCRYSVRLRQMFQKSSGRFQWLLGVFLVTVPHNMGTERVISHYNKIKTIHRQSSSEETLTKRLIISVSGVGTANYDPRPAVIKFLQAKDRRNRTSDLELYQNREFIEKFFRTETVV